jgi:hypothetical protein
MKFDLATLAKSTRSFLVKHSPEILTAVGVTGMIATTVMAVKVTPKASRLLEDLQAQKSEPLTKAEVVKSCWKYYIPAFVTGAASVTCLIGANSISMRRTAALAAAYQISETALTEYRDKVIETIGEKKEKVVREQIDKDHIESNPVSNNDVIVTKAGTTLCYDSLSGRYFESDIEIIKKAINELNRRMTYDTYISLNEFYDELDLSHTIMGDDLGWHIDGGLIEVYFTSQIADDGRPCIVMNFRSAPRYDYSKLM